MSAGWGRFGDTEVGPPPGFFLASRGSQPPWPPSTFNCITLLPSSQGLLPGSLWVLSSDYKDTGNWG